MKYVEAFRSLGYQVPNPRQDWSSDNESGVCITLWKSEVNWAPPPPRLSLWDLWVPGENHWDNLPGHRKRSGHIARAVQEFDGFFDAIIVSGNPGEGYDDADPWLPEKRLGYRWRITKFDELTGFFSAVAETN